MSACEAELGVGSEAMRYGSTWMSTRRAGMPLFDRLVFGWVGRSIALAGTLAIPLVGIVVLRFLLSDDPALAAPVVPSAAVTVVTTAPLPPSPGATIPAPAISPSPTPQPTPVPTPAPTLIGVVNATDGLNVRTEPSTQSRVLEILLFGSEVELTGRDRVSEGLLWVEVEGGGWVQSRFLDR